MQKHNNTIDALRFVAALIVVLFHLAQALPIVNNWYRNTVKYGWLGVPVFFVISGYCIILSAHNSSNVKDFLCRRLFRIFPPYWFSLLIVGFAAVFQKLYIGSNAVHFLPKTAPEVLAMLTLTTSPLTNIKTINWVYWSLTYELFFYLTVFLALLFHKKTAICFLIAVSVLSAVPQLHHIRLLFFLDQWPAFGLGISIYYYFKASDKISWLGFAALLTANLFSLIYLFYYHPEYIVVTLITTSLIVASNYLHMPENIFSKLGQYSYSVYLIHVPIGVFILNLFESSYIQQHPFANLAYDILVYLFINFIAWLIFTGIEKPSINEGRNISNKYFSTGKAKHTASS